MLLRDTETEGLPTPIMKLGSNEMPATAGAAGRLHFFGEIARGGMGVVLKARDTDLGRDLAVKVLLEQHRDNPETRAPVRRGGADRRPAPAPGDRPGLRAGRFPDRRPFFAMKLVKGQTLAALLAEPLRRRRTTCPGFLAIFEQVCQTLAYAHARGVIHRDLKPANVMVGGFGEVQVMDWGLAKVLRQGRSRRRRSGRGCEPRETIVQTARSGSGRDASQAGSVMGTPAYMAPEQARGEVERLDERADVFALGAILCEILTGRPAFTGRTPREVQAKAARADLDDARTRLTSMWFGR